MVVTGSTKLAGAIIDRFNADSIRVEDVDAHTDYDIFVNNAHVGFEQVYLLEKYFNAWRYDETKLIINISSRAGLPNLSKGYMYGAQKAALDHFADNLVYNSDKKCKITNINLGMLEDTLPSIKYTDVCDLIAYIISLPLHLEIPRIFLQHAHNYQDVQRLKAPRFETKIV